MSRWMTIAYVFALGGCWSSTSAPPAPPAAAPPPVAALPAGDEKFTGTLTEINFGCAADASCDLVVDGTQHVHFGHDTRLQGPVVWGTAESLWELMELPDQGVGRRVEVLAARVGDGAYTLEGKAEYYIRVLAP